MRDLIDGLEREVKAARTAGDIPALLALASTAIDELEAAAAAPGNDRVALLKSAKTIAYNAAADAWPGWEVDTPKRTDAELRAGQVMAERCTALVERLDLPAAQRGNAIWLVGAFDLARGDDEKAMAAFQSAASAFASEAEATLMAQGYGAIAAARSGAAQPAGAPDFETVIARLGTLSSKEADWFKTQLEVARQVFPPA